MSDYTLEVTGPAEVVEITTGATGPQGVPGPQGDTGDKGERGDTGDQGEPGDVQLTDLANPSTPAGTALAAASDAAAGIMRGQQGGALINPIGTNGSQVGPGPKVGANFGGTTSFPNTAGDSSLFFLTGYDNHLWDKTIAGFNTGYHCIQGGTSGHPTTAGGSRSYNFGGYAVVAGGIYLKNVGPYAGLIAGRGCSVGAKGVRTLAAGTSVGDTTITVSSSAGMVVGDFVYIDVAPELERATIVGIVGNAVQLTGFQAVTTTGSDGLGTGTSLALAHASGAPVLFHGDNAQSRGFGFGGGGDACHATGSNAAWIGGRNLMASGNWSTALGDGGEASGQASLVSGSNANARDANEHAIGVGVTGNQVSRRPARVQTTTTATTSLQVAAAVQPNSTVAYDLTLIARDQSTGDSKMWRVRGAYKGSSATPPAVTHVGGSAPVPEVVVSDSGASAWTAVLLVGTGTFNWRVTCPESGKTVVWETLIDRTQVI